MTNAIVKSRFGRTTEMTWVLDVKSFRLPNLRNPSETMLNATEYAAINLLHKSGCTQREIARLTNHERSTIGKVLRLGAPPPMAPRCRTKKMDAFVEYAKQRLKAGCMNSVRLLSSLRQRGFCGSLATVQRFIRRVTEEQLRGKMAIGIPCGSSLLTDGHHWMLRLLQGDITAEDLRTELGSTLSMTDAQLIADTVRTSRLGLRNRALTVAAHLKSIPARSVSQFLLIHRASVREYLKRYHEGGMAELLDLSRKEFKKADDQDYKDAVFKILHAPPQSCGFNRTTWRMADLKQALARQGTMISATNILRIIRKAGFRFRKAKKVLTSNDPDYRDKLKVITEILRNLKPDERFFSVDEFGPFAVKIQGGRNRVKPDEIRTVPAYQKSKGSLIATAALELSENQVTHFYSERKNTDEMLKLLEILLFKYASQSCIYFSWDAASWHASKKLYKRVEEVNSPEYRAAHCSPLIKLAPLPSCAQFLNVIESVFSGMARAVIHNSDYQSVQECMAAIDRHFAERNQHFKAHPKRAGNKLWGKEIVPPSFDEANNCKDPRW